MYLYGHMMVYKNIYKENNTHKNAYLPILVLPWIERCSFYWSPGTGRYLCRFVRLCPPSKNLASAF